MSRQPKDEKEDDAVGYDEQRPCIGTPQIDSLAIVYGDSSVEMRCPYCLERIHSELVLKPEIISVALGVCIFAVVPNFMMMLLIITLLQLTASRKHRCPLCERQLGSDGKFLIYFTDQVYSASLLSAGMICTKKNIMTAILIVLAVVVIFCRSYYENSNKFIATTWPEYLKECENRQPAFCLQKYKDREFKNWEGHLLRLQDNRQHETKWYLHAISLYMKMEPGRYSDGRPDVLLTLNTDALYYQSELVGKLVHGDLVRFNCSLHERQRGSLKDVMHFHVSELQIVGHDANYAMYTTPIEQEWIKIHVEDRGRLRSQPEAAGEIKPI